jgi:hypothetical protein
MPAKGEDVTIEQLKDFAFHLKELSKQIGFRLSSRGWAYQLENARLINKDQFDKVEDLVNRCRKQSLIPVDFVAVDESREFTGIEIPTSNTPIEFLKTFLQLPLVCEYDYIPDWWDGEEYYIQMLVEKIDLRTLFEPICKEYHIPIANSRGWSSMLQPAEYARRFREAEDNGLKCILLYCGDFDPVGMQISDVKRKNLADLKNVVWVDGTRGYDPANLIIDRFGLNKDFIDSNNLTWIDNLITSSGKNLADPSHKLYKTKMVQDWLRDIGERKCEANALVVRPEQAQELCRKAIEKYLGSEALVRFAEKTQQITEEMDRVRDEAGIKESIEKAIKLIDEYEKD